MKNRIYKVNFSHNLGKISTKILWLKNHMAKIDEKRPWMLFFISIFTTMNKKISIFSFKCHDSRMLISFEGQPS